MDGMGWDGMGYLNRSITRSPTVIIKGGGAVCLRLTPPPELFKLFYNRGVGSLVVVGTTSRSSSFQGTLLLATW